MLPLGLQPVLRPRRASTEVYPMLFGTSRLGRGPDGSAPANTRGAGAGARVRTAAGSATRPGGAREGSADRGRVDSAARAPTLFACRSAKRVPTARVARPSVASQELLAAPGATRAAGTPLLAGAARPRAPAGSAMARGSSRGPATATG